MKIFRWMILKLRNNFFSFSKNKLWYTPFDLNDWIVDQIKMISFRHELKMICLDLHWFKMVHTGISIFGVNKVHINKPIWHFWFQFENENEKFYHIYFEIDQFESLLWFEAASTSIAASHLFDNFLLFKWCH